MKKNNLTSDKLSHEQSEVKPHNQEVVCRLENKVFCQWENPNSVVGTQSM